MTSDFSIADAGEMREQSQPLDEASASVARSPARPDVEAEDRRPAPAAAAGRPRGRWDAPAARRVRLPDCMIIFRKLLTRLTSGRSRRGAAMQRQGLEALQQENTVCGAMQQPENRARSCTRMMMSVAGRTSAKSMPWCRVAKARPGSDSASSPKRPDSTITPPITDHGR